MTIQNQMLLGTTAKTFKYLKPLWESESKIFDRGAKGTVNVFQSGEGVRLQSIWSKIEYQEIVKQGNEIIYHIAK